MGENAGRRRGKERGGSGKRGWRGVGVGMESEVVGCDEKVDLVERVMMDCGAAVSV